MKAAEPVLVDDFFLTSKKIAKNFLHSVVVIDDQATFEEEAKPEILEEPAVGRGARAMEIKDPEPTEPQPQPAGESQAQSEALYVKQLNDCFADHGLICGVLKPTEAELGKIAEKADHIARRADIIVFDWYLSRSEKAGETALNSIHSILCNDLAFADGIEKASRMRLIAIYTSFINLKQIVEDTKAFLLERSMEFTSEPDDEFALKRHGVKIVFYRKDRGVKPQEDVLERTVSENVLIDRLIEDFTKMTLGLLSNVALDSLGALRNNTHRVLRKFERRLDPAYIAHRTMVTPSNEAQQHPVPLLTAEFNDVLEDCQVDRHVSLDVIKQWINYQIENGDIVLAGKVQNLNDQQLHEALVDLITNGVDSEFEKLKENGQLPAWKTLLSKVKKDVDSSLTNLLVTDNSGTVRNLDFAILTTMRSRYDKPEPLLTLGTIVAFGPANDEQYYVCMQPLCDSVRLKEDTVFPFIRLHDSSKPENGKVKDKFDIAVKDSGEYKKLRTVLKPRDVVLRTLRNQGHEEIRALRDAANGSFYFETVGDAQNLRWVSDLKFPHAQRIANDFAREISRVGLVESDWLRRMNS